MFEPLNYIPEPERDIEPAAPVPPRPPRARYDITRLHAAIASAAFLAFMLFLGFFIFPPKEYPVDTMMVVEDGETLSGLAYELEEAGAIRSAFAFKALVTLFGGTRGLEAGDYYLETRQNAIILAWRFANSAYDLRNIRVTIPEGTNSMEIADILAADERFTRFDPKEFERLSARHEGYLFPDTYLFLPNIVASDVVEAMLDNYERRIGEVKADIEAFGRPIADVIKMASIIEEEARTMETRRTIAGILWKRLDEGMPLQVDAAFAFVNGKKDSRYITLDDLRIDSPYNTYVKKGLPPTPISNPGLDAIKATIAPIKTRYYFYLSDEKGEMHYGVTHEDHLINKQKYIPW